MNNYRWDLQEVNLSLCGINVPAGGANDGFVSVQLPKRFEHQDGVHGDAVSFRTGTNTATFRLSMLITSPICEDLIALANEDIRSPSGAGIGSFLLENVDSGLEISGECRLDGYPTEISMAAQPSALVFEGKIFQAEVNYRARIAVP